MTPEQLKLWLDLLDTGGTWALLIVALYALYSGKLLSQKVYNKLIEERDERLLAQIEELVE